MNFGLVTSSVISGILLIGILALNARMNQESDYTVMHQVTKGNLNAITDYIEYDFRKAGYNAPPPKVVTADSTEFSFNGDVDDDGVVDQITWKITTNDVTGTKNPDDRVVQRVKNGNVTDITLGVTDFDLTYFKGNNVQTSNASNVKSIQVFLEVQSPAPIDGDYVTASWEKRFFPWNLQE